MIKKNFTIFTGNQSIVFCRSMFIMDMINIPEQPLGGIFTLIFYPQ